MNKPGNSTESNLAKVISLDSRRRSAEQSPKQNLNDLSDNEVLDQASKFMPRDYVAQFHRRKSPAETNADFLLRMIDTYCMDQSAEIHLKALRAAVKRPQGYDSVTASITRNMKIAALIALLTVGGAYIAIQNRVAAKSPTQVSENPQKPVQK